VEMLLEVVKLLSNLRSVQLAYLLSFLWFNLHLSAPSAIFGFDESNMFTSVSILAVLVAPVIARNCVNLTVPVDISSRNAVFNIDVPQTNLDATTFIQNSTQQGRNFTDVALSGYATVSGSYKISAQFCVPSEAQTASTSTVQILTHGIGFDKT